jgi:hypothetical protein
VSFRPLHAGWHAKAAGRYSSRRNASPGVIGS